VHVSELRDERVENPRDVVKEGDEAGREGHRHGPARAQGRAPSVKGRAARGRGLPGIHAQPAGAAARRSATSSARSWGARAGTVSRGRRLGGFRAQSCVVCRTTTRGRGNRTRISFAVPPPASARFPPRCARDSTHVPRTVGPASIRPMRLWSQAGWRGAGRASGA